MPHPPIAEWWSRDVDELEDMLFDETGTSYKRWMNGVRASRETWVGFLTRLPHMAGGLSWESSDPVLLDLLADPADPWGEARHAAFNRFTPPQSLARLATAPDPEVRAALTWNPALPADVLATLAADRDGVVRKAVAERYQRWFEAERTAHRVQAELAVFAERRARRQAERAARDAFRRNAKRAWKASQQEASDAP